MALFTAALWLGALMAPAVYAGREAWPGWIVLLFGWMGVFVSQFGWFANLGFLANFGLMLGSRPPRRLDLAAAVMSLAAAVNALFWRKLYYDSGERLITAFGLGFYLWQAAILSLACWVIWLWTRTQRQARGTYPDQDGNFSAGRSSSA